MRSPKLASGKPGWFSEPDDDLGNETDKSCRERGASVGCCLTFTIERTLTRPSDEADTRLWGPGALDGTVPQRIETMKDPKNRAHHSKEGWFRMGCVVVGVIHVFFGSMVLLSGAQSSLEEFEIPREILRSAHYMDAIRWVYVHQLCLGLTIALVGCFAQSPALKRNFCRLMLLVNAAYTFLDFGASDSIVGNSLYKGPMSLVPGSIALICTLIFLCLVFVDRDPTTQANL